MAVNHSDARREIWLLLRSPHSETGAGSWLQHTEQLSKCTLRVGEEHHTEARSRQIKAVVGKRQRLRVRLLCRKVFESALSRALGGNLQKIRAKVRGRDVAVRTDPRSESDSGFAGTAGHIEHIHPGERAGIVGESFGNIAAHGPGFSLPLLGSRDPKSRAPVFVWCLHECAPNR